MVYFTKRVLSITSFKMYLRRLIKVFIIAIVSITVVGKYFDYRYQKRWDWLYFDKINKSVAGSQNYDVLLFGNSRIHTGVNPYYIDSVTRLNAYNLAIGSGDEQEIKLLGTAYLQSHTPPKFIIIGIDNSLLAKHNILKERFAYLFYLSNDTIRSFMNRNGFPADMINIAPFLKYAVFDEYNRTSLFLGSGEIIKIFKHNFYKGFVNIFEELNTDSAEVHKKLRPKLFNTLPTSEHINDSSLSIFRQTVEMFLAKGCKVVFLFPPELQKDNSLFGQAADSFYMSLVDQYSLKQIRADKNPVFTKQYFVEGSHVNEPGSELLSLIVADSLKSLMQQKPGD